MRRFSLAAVTLAVALAAPAGAASFSIDPAHTSAGFAVRHLALTTVRGTIPVTKGTVTTDAADLPTAVDVALDLKGINTGNERRDNDLRSPNWFDAEKYPTMTFVSTRVEGTAAAFKLYGNLTFHGVTKPVVLDGKIEGKMKTQRGRTRIAYEAQTTIDRHDWEVRAPGLTDAAAGSDITISIETEVDGP